MSETEATIGRLLDSNALREPVLRAMIEALRLPAGSRGLDAGCGIGLQALLLAEAVGTAGHVTGLDLEPALLRHGEATVQARGLAERITFRQADVSRLPFEDDSFDWVWSVDCIGYPAGRLLPVLQELVRVVRPGGCIALMAWTSQCLLPGYPLLEARLNAVFSAFIPYLHGTEPENQFLRAPGWFARAGLEQVECRSFVGEVRAPLTEAQRCALLSLFQMLWLEPETGAEDAEWRDYQRLCRPESPEFILNLADYYAFFTYTMVRGTVPA